MAQIQENKKRFPTACKYIAGCAGVFILLLIFAAIAGRDMPKQTGDKASGIADNLKEKVVSGTNTPTPAQTTTTPTPETKKEKTIMDKAWEALDNSIKTRDKFDIQYIEADKLVRITKEPDSYSDETAFVKITYWDFVRYGRLAFQIDDVEAIEFLYWNNFTDSYGKTSREKGVNIAMKKSEFQKYDWSKLQGQNIYNQMLTSCYEHYINPAVMNYVKTDKLTLLSLSV